MIDSGVRQTNEPIINKELRAVDALGPIDVIVNVSWCECKFTNSSARTML